MGNSLSSTPEPRSRRKSESLSIGNDLHRLALAKRAADTRQKAIEEKTHDVAKENQQILKKLFKRLDPTVSKVDYDVQGEIQVSVKYDAVNSNLLVNVIKCRDLGLNEISGKTAEPFVILYLYPDPENVGVKQTSTSTKSQNPAYNEKFVFAVEEVALSDTKLILKVLDQDPVTDEQEFLGEVVISLPDFNFVESPVHTAWYTLVPQTDLRISGEVDVSLNFSLPDNLSITIHRATNLKLNPNTGKTNAVVKVGIPGIEQISVTQVKLNTVNPVWEETFTFDMPQEELSLRYVVLTVLDNVDRDGDGESDCLLGHAVIDLENLDVQNGLRSSFTLSDMSHSDRLRNKWFQTTQVQEFREALFAHSFFNYPNLLFQKHEGRKVIRLMCKSAGGASARLRLNNGIPAV